MLQENGAGRNLPLFSTGRMRPLIFNCAYPYMLPLYSHTQSPHPLPPATTIILHLYISVISRMLCKWNHGVYDLSKLAFLIQCNTLEIQPYQ